MADVVIVEAVRTPVGRRNGELSTVHPVDLLAATPASGWAVATSVTVPTIVAFCAAASVEPSASKKVDLYLDLADLLEGQMHEPMEAIAAYQSAVAADASCMEALRQLERLYRQNEMWEQLIDVLGRIADLETDSDEIVRRRLETGLLWDERLLDSGQAIQAYQEVLTTDPHNLSALRALEQLGLVRRDRGGDVARHRPVDVMAWKELCQRLLGAHALHAMHGEGALALHLAIALVQQHHDRDVSAGLDGRHVLGVGRGDRHLDGITVFSSEAAADVAQCSNRRPRAQHMHQFRKRCSRQQRAAAQYVPAGGGDEVVGALAAHLQVLDFTKVAAQPVRIPRGPGRPASNPESLRRSECIALTSCA